MRNILLIIFIVANALILAYKEERTFLDRYVPLLRIWKTFSNNKWEQRNDRRLSSGSTHSKKFQDLIDYDFPCNLNITLRSKERPNNAHKLRPGDIDVIGAIGDSLTAGFGVEANNILAVVHEGRGSSFSIGGAESWKSYLTLPNILRNFNPNIYGYSLNSISTDRKSKFNVAEGGAISENMPYMAKVLVKRIKNDKNVDVEKDWKMITVFIGHNDFCSVDCYKRDFDRVLIDHKNDMLNVLRIFRDNLPRTVVNLIPPIHLKILLRMTDKPKSCDLSHLFLCPCMIGSANLHLRSRMLQLITKWQLLDLEIASDYPEFDREDFTVIAHNFTLDFTLPRTSSGGFNYNYAAPDCFHASQRGHAKAANDLWNSLLEPYGLKSVETKPEFERFLCPTEENPYIFTKRNSKCNT